MINIFSKSAANAQRFRIPDLSAYHVITLLVTIIVLQIGAIAYLVDMKVLATAAILNAAWVVYMGVRHG